LRPGEAALSVVPYGELPYGAAQSAHRSLALQRLRDLVQFLAVLALPEKAADNYGMIRAELESKRKMIGNNGLWIAAHALAAGLILVTNKEKEFWRVGALKVRNWAA
jgi:tRNA(fMet)-specific endonuclease VapC